MAIQPADGYGGGYQPKDTGGKKPKAPPRDPGRTAPVKGFTVTEVEAQRVLAWFGQAASVAPGDFELAARIRRAFE